MEWRGISGARYRPRRCRVWETRRGMRSVKAPSWKRVQRGNACLASGCVCGTFTTRPQVRTPLDPVDCRGTPTVSTNHRGGCVCVYEPRFGLGGRVGSSARHPIAGPVW